MTRRYTRRRALQLGAGLAGAVLVGCLGGDGDGADVQPSRIRVRTRASSAPPSPERGVLRLGGVAKERGQDGLNDTGRLIAYSRLVGLDPRTAAVYGDLAHEVEIPEPLTVRFGLRQGVFFHPDRSGSAQPLVAQSVVEDFRRRRDEGVFLFTDVIDSMEASSDTDLTLHLRAPFSLLFEFLARPDASVRRAERYDALPAPQGGGAFMPVSSDDFETVFQASPLRTDDAAPRLAEVRIRWAERARELDAMFVQREVDVHLHPDRASRDAVSGAPSREELARPAQRMRGLALSLLSGPDQPSPDVAAFRDSRVRRAISIALDRAGLRALDDAFLCGPVGPAFAGDALPEAELASHLLFQHSIDGAVTLLRAAQAEGLAMRVSHSEAPGLQAHAERLMADLNAVGLDARLVSRPQPEFQTAFAAGDFEAAFFELDRLTTPDLGLRLHTTGGLDGSGSPWGYSNPVFDSQVRDALSQVDPMSRSRLSRDAQRLLLGDVPALLPLTAPIEYASVAAGVDGFEFDAYEFNAGILAAHWEAPVRRADPAVGSRGRDAAGPR